MKIYVGADHNGFDYKHELIALLHGAGHEVVDAGGVTRNPDDDFPVFAGQVVHQILADNDHDDVRGILICGSGQGMCMAANRFKGIRASLCWNADEARSARNDDNSNVLCLSSKFTTIDDAKQIIDTWLHTPFAAAPRYLRRLRELDELN
jgi:ribose 5-phosphate isomerase B